MSKLLLEENFLEKIDSDKKSKLELRLKELKISLETYIEKLIYQDIEIIRIKNGYTYNLKTRELLNTKDKTIQFTSYEKDIINYLATNKERCISNAELIKKIWKYKPNTTIFTVRNKIRNIRLKTCSDLIINNKNLGYKLNIINI